MNRRLQEFDVLRVTAAFAVIAIHITAGYVSDLPLAYLWNHIVRFAVPLFIVMSGFILYYTDRKNLPAQVFYKKRLNRILCPYIFWTCLYGLLNAYFLGLKNPTVFVNTLSKDLLWGTGYYHLYFLPIILQLYLLYPLLRRWLDKSTRSLFVVSLILTLGVQSLLYLYMLHIISLPGQYSLLYVRAFPVWLFYFVFGMFAAMNNENCKGAKGTVLHDTQSVSTEPSPWHPVGTVVISGLIWLVSLGLMLFDSKTTAIQGSIVRPSVILYTLSSYFFFYSLALQLRNIKRPWLTWISAQSFLIYLMHPLLLTILVKISAKLGHPGLWAGNRGVLSLYVVTMVSTIVMTYLVSRTPLASLLGGIRKVQGE